MVPEDPPASAPVPGAAGPGQGHCDALVPYSTCPNPALSPPPCLSPRLTQDSPPGRWGTGHWSARVSADLRPTPLRCAPPPVPAAQPGSGTGRLSPRLALCCPSRRQPGLPPGSVLCWLPGGCPRPALAGGPQGATLTPQPLLMALQSGAAGISPGQER